MRFLPAFFKSNGVDMARYKPTKEYKDRKTLSKDRAAAISPTIIIRSGLHFPQF